MERHQLIQCQYYSDQLTSHQVLDLATTKLMGYMRNCTREEIPGGAPAWSDHVLHSRLLFSSQPFCHENIDKRVRVFLSVVQTWEFPCNIFSLSALMAEEEEAQDWKRKSLSFLLVQKTSYIKINASVGCLAAKIWSDTRKYAPWSGWIPMHSSGQIPRIVLW